MKRPAFQFYPADWRKDVELQSCSMAAQGMWINMMCIAHECEPYGHLTINGKPMNSAQIGRHVGLSAKEAEALISELLDAGVARRNEQGVLFSYRMVKDEDLRNRRANGGQAGAEHGIKGAEFGVKGGRPAKNKDGNKPPLQPPSKPPLEGHEAPPLDPPPSSSSSSSSSNTERSVCVDPPAHTHIPPDFQAEARTARPDLTDIQPVYQDFVAHYGTAGATINRWRKWLLRERQAGSEPTSAAAGTHGHDPDSRASIEATGQALGLGKWDELEQFSTYKARVRAAQWQARAPTAKGVQ